jgi:hypothetical protein
MQEEKLLYSKSLYLQHPLAAYKKSLKVRSLQSTRKAKGAKEELDFKRRKAYTNFAFAQRTGIKNRLFT